jgi:hypothetical protein
MGDPLYDLKQMDSWDDVRAGLGELANLGGPASSPVTRRALEDPRFAFYLLLTRDAPDHQRRLLDDPRNVAWVRADEDAPARQLIGAAAKALVRWGAGGFRTVSDDTYQARLATCGACPQLTLAPERAIYEGLTLLSGDRRVCSACGCGVAAKAKLPDERCPLQKWNAASNADGPPNSPRPTTSTAPASDSRKPRRTAGDRS